jgi:hypothetical protein
MVEPAAVQAVSMVITAKVRRLLPAVAREVRIRQAVPAERPGHLAQRARLVLQTPAVMELPALGVPAQPPPVQRAVQAELAAEDYRAFEVAAVLAVTAAVVAADAMAVAVAVLLVLTVVEPAAVAAPAL